MRPIGPARPHRRDGIWYLVRRVPQAYKNVVPQALVRVSTGIRVADDPKGIRARAAVLRLDLDLQSNWAALLAGGARRADPDYAGARNRSRELGLNYYTSAELAAGPLDEILKRVDLLVQRDSIDNANEVAAVLGGAEVPPIRLSGLVERYSEIVRSELRQMSSEQRRKWRNPRLRAVANFIKVIGDKDISKLTRSDALQYRSWWEQRVDVNAVDVRTANRDMGALSRMLRRLDVHYGLGIPAIFSGLLLGGGRIHQREAFSPAWVQTKILARGALDGLNDEAKHLVYLLAETGLRPSEAAALQQANIILDHPVPHVRIRPAGRVLKTVDSERDIPLVGCALEVMHMHPDGFPRYRDRDALSALVNAYFLRHGLLETRGQSLYSLRHTFEDRLTAVEAPEKVVATLMGHKWHRPRYGKGPSLEQKRSWLERIVFALPGA